MDLFPLRFFRDNNRNDNVDDFDEQLIKALTLSQQTFDIEEKKRKEEESKELQKINEIKIKNIETANNDNNNNNKNISKWDDITAANAFLDVMNWNKQLINQGVGVGIQNLGNSCFMNATLQCLTYSPSFVQLLMQNLHSPTCKNTKSFCALCEMEQLLPSILTSDQIVKPYNLFRNLSNINDLLTPGCQEDSHEFLQSLLDRCEQAYDDAVKPEKKKDPYNIIRKIFTGSTKTQITCAKCRNKTCTEEPFTCISLEVDPKQESQDLSESLTLATHAEMLRGNDSYYCDKCQGRGIASKQLTLAKLPPILIFHFKRFACLQYNPNHKEMAFKKLHNHITFPEIFDFQKHIDFVHEDNKQQILRDYQYELYAVLIHSGPELGYGHYYALIKSPDNYWFRMNDMDIVPLNLTQVLQEQAYMLFYRRTTHNILQDELIQAKHNHKLFNNNLSDHDNNNTINNTNSSFVVSKNQQLRNPGLLGGSLDNNVYTNRNVNSDNDGNNNNRDNTKENGLLNVDYFFNSCLEKTKVIETDDDMTDIDIDDYDDDNHYNTNKNSNLPKNNLQFTPNNTISTFICNEEHLSSQTTTSNFANNVQLVDKIDRKTYVKIPGLATRPEIPDINDITHNNFKNCEHDDAHRSMNDVVQVDNDHSNHHFKTKINDNNDNDNYERFEEIFWPQSQIE